MDNRFSRLCKRFSLPLIAGVLLTLGIIPNDTWSAPPVEWTCINVNSRQQQGDAHLMRMGDSHVLIDTGHSDYTENTLIPFLKSRQVRTLERIVISHAHNDHYGGLVGIIKSGIKVRQVMFNGTTKAQCDAEPWGCSWAELEGIAKTMNEAGVPIDRIIEGVKWRYANDMEFEVLGVWDGIHTPIGKTDLNDTSALISFRHGKIRILFTGDLNHAGGAWWASQPERKALLASTILKAPHHGTEGFAPNSFFEAVRPADVIIPSPAYLWDSDRSSRLRNLATENGWKTYVNGKQGHIVVESFGTHYRIKTE